MPRRRRPKTVDRPNGPGYTISPKALPGKGCDVCGRTGIMGRWGLEYTSDLDDTKLHVCVECYGARNAEYMRKKWKEAVDKAFPNLVKYWADKQPKEDENGKVEEKAGEAGGAGGTGQAGQNEDGDEDNAK